jgi:hypothetical protein
MVLLVMVVEAIKFSEGKLNNSRLANFATRPKQRESIKKWRESVTFKPNRQPNSHYLIHSFLFAYEVLFLKFILGNSMCITSKPTLTVSLCSKNILKSTSRYKDVLRRDYLISVRKAAWWMAD